MTAHRRALSVLDESNFHDRLAAEFAPILCHFVIALLERTKGLDRVWFMARDGYLPMKLYDLFAHANAPKSGYLHVSRKALMSASSPSYGLREAYLAHWNGGNDQLATLLIPLSMTSDELENLVKRYGFANISENVDYRNDPRFHRLVGGKFVRERMSSLNAQAKAGLFAYLGECGFMANANVAVVDVGWAGQIQEALEMALSGNDAKPSIKGLYLALRELGGQRRAAGLDMTGLFYDCATPRWRAATILSAVDIFEDTCRAHHGTVVGYDAGQPILAEGTHSRRSEAADERRLLSLHDSILRYATAFAKANEELSVTSGDMRDIAETAALSLVRFPDAERYAFFASMGHSLDYGTEEPLPVEGCASRFNVFSAVSGARNARWKEGYLSGSAFRITLQTAMAAARVVGRRGCCGSGKFAPARISTGRRERAAMWVLHWLAGTN